MAFGQQGMKDAQDRIRMAKAQMDAGKMQPSEYNAIVDQATQEMESDPSYQTLKQRMTDMGMADKDPLNQIRSQRTNVPDSATDTKGNTEAMDRYRQWAEAAQERQAYQADFDPTGQEQQQYALGLQQEAAFGLAPSAAENLMRRGMEQSVNDQYAMAASARGGGGSQALAMRQAQLGSANAQQDFASQQAALRANEMAQARGAYMQGATGLRDSNYQQTMAQADLEMKQRQLNDQAMQGMTAYEAQTRGMNQQSLGADRDARNQSNMTDRRIQADKDIAAMNKRGGDGLLGTLEGLAGAAIPAVGAIKAVKSLGQKDPKKP